MPLQDTRPQMYDGQGDALMEMEHEELADRITIMPDALPSKTPDDSPRVRIMWGQHLLDDLRVGLGVGRHRDSERRHAWLGRRHPVSIHCLVRPGRRRGSNPESECIHKSLMQTSYGPARPSTERVFLWKSWWTKSWTTPLPSGRSSAYHGPSTGCRPPREGRPATDQSGNHSGMFSAWAGTGPLNPRSPAPAREAGIDGQ